MKILMSVLILLVSASVYAAPPVGSVEVVFYPDLAGGFGAYQVNDTGDKLVGVSGGTVYLEKKNGVLQGFSFGRPFKISCSETQCADSGSTEVNLKLTPVANGYKLEGTLNYVFVNATVTNSKIDFSAAGGATNVGFELGVDRNGVFSGDGVLGGARTFTARVTATGTLAGLKDPATFIALIASPLIGK